jgi:hypothetical protein
MLLSAVAAFRLNMVEKARWLVPKLKSLLLEMGSRILRTNHHKEGESLRDRMNTKPLKPSLKT